MTSKKLALVFLGLVIIGTGGAVINAQEGGKQKRTTQEIRRNTTEGGLFYNVTNRRNFTRISRKPGPSQNTKRVQHSPKKRPSRPSTASKYVQAAVQEMAIKGLTVKFSASRGYRYNNSPAIRLIEVGTFKLTAYTAGYESTGKRPGDRGYGHTYSGRMVTKDITVAACLKQFPTGTLLYIEGLGVRRVDDKGSDITKNKLDVYIPKLHDAKHFGVIHRKVYIIKGVK